MQRVSSRPRLVSWDKDETDGSNRNWKDANIDTEEEVVMCPTPFVKRKIAGGKSISPLILCDPTRSYTLSRSALDMLCNDEIGAILSFLKPSDLRNVQITCMRLHSVCREQHIWMPHVAKIWPVLKHAMTVGQRVTLVDDYYTECTTNGNACCDTALNMSLLHGISARHPISIHKSFFTKGRKDFVAYSNQKREVLVQFAGVVGFGDRSIVSNIPFPSSSANHKENNNANPHTRWPHSILEMLCRGAKDASEGFGFTGPNAMRPFVAPYVMKNGQLNCTPRLVVYYEVTLVPPTRNQSQAASPRRTTECVAVGLSTSNFPHYAKMPGWDSFSYGYHSDDGGIFHAQGDMLRHYGPQFSSGDTVGCGIDYANHGIFYTLNGRFLGYAWLGIDTTMKYYACIGVDTDLALKINFGQYPYQFNLQAFNQQYSSKVETLFVSKCSHHCNYDSLFHPGPGRELNSINKSNSNNNNSSVVV
uniref:B30.2/SPRY domain-containing protein n=1 Tax=Leptocylindrus danicus TaxID=163516 RepID=A0A7S2JZ83_9STRA|mmetsp:Transcript_14769/g.21816  ORF Transcript_14769/g.21816 Transcript_14769/m.21816 type:complete len:475 (+) Transcript_14769:100-1524(+)|eukprot:CAMPEP_0116024976 /NCGR_PEP_ID=MMETSP0321-20121206/12708_1 /TAXON_ID=163516 /ORGANISM="Leptocylindrus danicus var. danicus, Strain B650" /LENGTH=474 /DNA_ID=CAMNT_0003496951 /DNA_START=100 /DNA_END=1524 /DNA_ORIENTATION=-